MIYLNLSLDREALIEAVEEHVTWAVFYGVEEQCADLIERLHPDNDTHHVDIATVEGDLELLDIADTTAAELKEGDIRTILDSLKGAYTFEYNSLERLIVVPAGEYNGMIDAIQSANIRRVIGLKTHTIAGYDTSTIALIQWVKPADGVQVEYVVVHDPSMNNTKGRAYGWIGGTYYQSIDDALKDFEGRTL